ncbi:hypothetical protein AUF78_04195 [archaeon 13_1_20CM_2_51_12]|nr:MAG: hypothetical protein AUF78_04195 [archaeon 13_1_20CM_2_51_12]
MGLLSVRLVFIYGPPAVGKLTVAIELSKQIGFKLYHNHVSIDFVKSIFQFGTPPLPKIGRPVPQRDA